jgi:hypothetical protein
MSGRFDERAGVLASVSLVVGIVMIWTRLIPAL